MPSPWERVRLPYLWCGERLVWVGALGVDSRLLRAHPGSGRIRSRLGVLLIDLPER
ncbi:MAG: hypothetical protein IPL29_03860 [Propionivibrio sp.]|nr:hypothetical protein [Propionivibrio sp.]